MPSIVATSKHGKISTPLETCQDFLIETKPKFSIHGSARRPIKNAADMHWRQGGMGHHVGGQ